MLDPPESEYSHEGSDFVELDERSLNLDRYFEIVLEIFLRAEASQQDDHSAH